MVDFKTTLRKKIDALLGGTHNHFSCFLPGDIGFFSSFLLNLFFAGIKIEEDQVDRLNHIPKDAIVVFTTKHKSNFDFLFYYYHYKRKRLPFPQIGFNHNVIMWQPVSRILKIILSYIDFVYQYLRLPDPYGSEYVKKELLNGRSGFLNLVDKKGFYRWFVKDKADPVQYLIQIQTTIERPIYIVPHLMFFSTKPVKFHQTLTDLIFGTENNPGRLRRLFTLLKDPTKTFVEISEPVSLKDFLELPENQNRTIEHQTLVLRRNLLIQFNRHRQSVTGPVLKTRQELKEDILTNDRLKGFMHQYAERRKLSIQKVRKQADAYLEEIAANYNSAIVSVGIVIIKYIIKSMFEGIMISEDGLKQVKNAAQKAPVIFMPCHKSHVDYLILPYVLYNNNMPCPHAVAGKNLFFWPVAPFLRGGGAFSVRRSFRGAVFYTKVFSEYIYKLLEEGFNIEVFFEGGRSRTGKLLTPQLGFFNILLDAYKEGACDDLIFAPIYIGYDRVLEESSYVHELEGGQKEPESLFQILKAVRLIRRKYGKIYINFHEPISLNEQMAEYGKRLTDMSSKEQNTMCRNLGHKFLYAIDKVTIVNPHAIVASAILNSSKTIFSYTRLRAYIATYIDYLTYQKANMAGTLIADPTQAVKRAIDSYVERKFIEPVIDKNQTSLLEYYRVNVNKRIGLEYYKNNAISFFVPAAFTALSILSVKSTAFTTSDLLPGYTFLQEIFKNEFAYDTEKEPDFFVHNNIEAFMNLGIITAIEAEPGAYSILTSGIERLQHFSGFLKPYFESYKIVLRFFTYNPKNSIAAKDRLKKIMSLGKRMYKEQRVERYESLSKINYENAVSFFLTHGVKGSESTESIELYSSEIEKYLTLLAQ